MQYVFKLKKNYHIAKTTSTFRAHVIRILNNFFPVSRAVLQRFTPIFSCMKAAAYDKDFGTIGSDSKAYQNCMLTVYAIRNWKFQLHEELRMTCRSVYGVSEWANWFKSSQNQLFNQANRYRFVVIWMCFKFGIIPLRTMSVLSRAWLGYFYTYDRCHYIHCVLISLKAIKVIRIFCPPSHQFEILPLCGGRYFPFSLALSLCVCFSRYFFVHLSFDFNATSKSRNLFYFFFVFSILLKRLTNQRQSVTRIEYLTCGSHMSMVNSQLATHLIWMWKLAKCDQNVQLWNARVWVCMCEYYGQY